MINYPDYLIHLIDSLKKLPGIGYKSAEKLAFEMLFWKEHKLKEVANAIADISKQARFCKECFCLVDTNMSCYFCHSQERTDDTLCVVASCKDVFLLERARVFDGRYHVLGALLSPVTGKQPEPSRVETLKKRIIEKNYTEVILSLDATLEGDATAMFIRQELEPLNVSVSRLALGIPMGLSFDFVDSGTLARAFSGRSSY